MNVFTQFFKSLYSPKDIAIFRFQGIGKTILYIFVMMAIVSLPAGINVATSFTQGVNQFQQALEQDVPDFEFVNGTLTSKSDEPMIDETADGTFIFDTTGTITLANVQEYEQAFALLQHEAILVTDGVPQQLRYQDFGNLSLTKTETEAIAATVSELMPIIIALVLFLMYLFVTALKFIGIVALSLIGFIVRKSAQVKLSYKQLWILSAYAVTLPTTLFGITDALRIYLPFSFTIYWAIAIVMLNLIVKKVPKPKSRMQQ
ncbi:DUF1189 domain-containing protein [Desertibacillus haloalkaliphilus]|uniref:DUF1189 domain-containing protein n=1 Tax=Desertibacillus haloalkaliphilus TaxID=1328930 RepID=UPI001C27AF3A|nr:DUF1189 domain-containing protein [Desertibacillus haloalkaliphilus]MBU8905709.1 DUF1189 domain-containing protein [Desertibacillus haloalkaliphilus]